VEHSAGELVTIFAAIQLREGAAAFVFVGNERQGV